MTGVKFDGNKPRFSLIPLSPLIEIINVLEFGAQKYASNNWKNVPNAETRYFDAAMRHLLEYRSGEKIDSESGLSHLSHAACCLLFLMWFDSNEGNT
ncbi:dATP/dGTP diphosphohydrolase domain-containing protein [Xenorhabdus eapokensis]|uniref:dATP/dGTP diphosphohydrolase N-terminal domain-containing protein n=1 Tax=Xenorhabdus eapokensis TaxID=1873482 RepID=A0A1Q5TQS8_9GAMM|nr:hypothetical protein Xedl_02230 [Xenorhabdus eapokensis]